ncbi:MAG: hypothetical protein M1839_007135 [Geoglossum umbratile]|nr:MAG: hypothetical protein M1839_007135 [Geoglossum umbratile]
MNFGQSWATVLTLFGCHLTFYVQTWEEYHTKTLYLGLVSGPVEGILTLCAVFCVTAYNGGAHFWQQTVFQVLGAGRDTHGFGWVPSWLGEVQVNRSFLVYGGVILGYNVLESCRNVARTRRANDKPTLPALLGLAPFFLTWALVPIYLSLQPTILTTHLLPFSFFLGLLNALSVGLIITAHLTKSPFPQAPNILVLLLLFGALDSAGIWLEEYSGGAVGWPSALGDGVYQVGYMFFCMGTAAGVYGSFVVDVVRALCEFLDIWCLVIKHPWTGNEGANGVVEGKKGK